MLLQPGGAVCQDTGIIGGQQVQETLVAGLCVELQQCSIYIFTESISAAAATHLVQVANEETFEALYLLLVSLCQVVQVSKFMKWWMATRERGRGGKEQRIKRDQLPYIQQSFPKTGIRKNSI